MANQLSKEIPKRPALSVERKLELSQMMRQEQDYNRYQMGRREMLLYGQGRKPERGSFRYRGGRFTGGYAGASGMLKAAEAQEAVREQEWDKEQKRNRVSLMIRGFLSVLLFVIALLMRFENLSIGGVDYQNLTASLQSEEFIKGIGVFDFEESMPYTKEEQTPPLKADSPNGGQDDIRRTEEETDQTVN